EQPMGNRRGEPMRYRPWAAGLLVLSGSVLLAPYAASQQEKKKDGKKEEDRRPPFGPGGPGGGRGGFGGPMGPASVRKLVKQFDKDGDGRLNKEERKAAREFLKKQGGGRGRGPGGFGRGGPGGRGGFGIGNFLAKPLLEA